MKRLLLAIALAFALVGISAVLPVNSRPEPVKADFSDKYDGDCTGNETEGRCADKPAFDHSNCQYPDRWSNPVNGCDNSDPAVPECIKAAYSKESEDACIAAYVAQQQPTTPSTVPESNPNTCGGK